LFGFADGKLFIGSSSFFFMFFDWEIFWKKERIIQLVRQQNSIKRSFLELVKGTGKSVVILLLFWLGNQLFFHNSSISGMDFFIIFLTIFVWINALVMALMLKYYTRDLHLKPYDADDIADSLTVVNTLNQNTLAFNIVAFSLLFLFSPSSGLNNPFLVSSSEGFPFLFGIAVFFLLMGFVFFLLSIRMQVLAVKEIYPVNNATAWITVLSSLLITWLVVQCLSFFFMLFFLTPFSELLTNSIGF
jgi:hypothetical protein